MTAAAETQGRIAELQGRMHALCSPAVPSSAARTGASSGASSPASSGASFAAALAASTRATGAVTSATPAPAGGAGTGQALVDAANKYLGVPYVWGGEDPATGLDCSGLVQRAMADVGVAVPRVARDQGRLGTPVASIDQAKPGDLLVFDGGSHIAIYVGDGRMLDAPKPGKSVSVRAVYETPKAIRRVLPEAAAATAPTSTSTLATAADLQRYALTMMSEGLAA